MERPQMIGGEECHSSESGWTMYIGSPIDDDDDGHSDDGDGEDNDTQADDAEDESDDSMASDASSGPSHYGNPWGNREGGYGLADSQQAADDHERDEKFCLDKKENKRKGKKVAEARSDEKNEMGFINKKSKAPGVQGHDKVRKNIWVDRKK